jgi:hypothetical protein
MELLPELLAAVTHLIDADFEWQMRDNPEFASQAGRHEYSDKLQDLSPLAFDARVKYLETTATTVKDLSRQLDAHAAVRRTAVSDSAAVSSEALLRTTRETLDLFGESVTGELSGLRQGLHLYPINSIGYGGVHHNFLEVSTQTHPLTCSPTSTTVRGNRKLAYQ